VNIYKLCVSVCVCLCEKREKVIVIERERERERERAIEKTKLVILKEKDPTLKKSIFLSNHFPFINFFSIVSNVVVASAVVAVAGVGDGRGGSGATVVVGFAIVVAVVSFSTIATAFSC
jgi:hypothetical protein